MKYNYKSSSSSGSMRAIFPLWMLNQLKQAKLLICGSFFFTFQMKTCPYNNMMFILKIVKQNKKSFFRLKLWH